MNPNLLSDPSVVFDTAAPQRVVSLVPSVTASLFDLGFGSTVVGITDYCTGLPESAADLPRVGGPKNLAVEAILALKPDLVLANQEENDQTSVEALAEAGIPVWLSFPTTVQAAVNDLWTIANLFRSDSAMHQVDYLERAVEWARAAGESQEPLRYFCPIWQDELASGEAWWMTFNAQTYPHDVLSLFGGANVFADRSRRYPLSADLGLCEQEDPGGRDTRYPRVSASEILQAQPELILLPSEPFAYSEDHCQEFSRLFAGTPAAKAGRIYTVDGTLITWHGTRLVRALDELPAFFSV